jgi:hypothetical protein
VSVILSATTEVSKESIVPNKANESAVNKYGVKEYNEKLVNISKLGFGKPVGISPITL